MDINSKIYLGLPSDTSPDEELENGGFEDGSGGATNFATGGSISYDGLYKIHTFTPANDGTNCFVVSNEITGAEILLVAGGGGGSSGGGGGGEVLEYTGETIAAGNYTLSVGEGGADGNSNSSNGSAGGNSTGFGYTANGGGYGAKFGSNGGAGDCGGGGGNGTGTTTGGTGDQGNGAGNCGNYGAYYPAGGGGGAGGNASCPPAPDIGANGGTGKASDITGTSIKYGGGGGGGGYLGSAGSGKDGGGNGRAGLYAGGYDGTDGRGGGGGGGGQYASGGDGGNGVIIIRYEDAADYNFDDWTENAGVGHVFADEGIVYAGSQSCKLTGGAEIYQEEDAGIVAGNRMRLTFWSYGDGTWEVYDNDNAAIISSGNLSSSGWEQTVYQFEVPTGCTDIKVSFTGDDCYFDAVSLKDYGTTVWTLNEDWLSSPPPRWDYGLSSSEPDAVVAGTGRASFTLDNTDGEYSPDHDSCIAGF